MKVKIMALMLAVGMGVTSVAMTVQAAEEKPGCAHLTQIKVTQLESAGNATPDSHIAKYYIRVTCGDCGNLLDDYHEYITEPHDYEQTFLDNGRVMLYCIACHDHYYK